MRRRTNVIRLLAAAAVATIGVAALAVPASATQPAPKPECTITGTTGPDLLKGTPGDDVICGLGGKDVLVGLGGDDVLIGGPGRDVMSGGSGNDRFIGGAGKDVVDDPENAPGNIAGGFFVGVKFSLKQETPLTLTPVEDGSTECSVNWAGDKYTIGSGEQPYVALFYARDGLYNSCFTTSASAAYDVYEKGTRVGRIWFVATQPGGERFRVTCEDKVNCAWSQDSGESVQGVLVIGVSSL